MSRLAAEVIVDCVLDNTGTADTQNRQQKSLFFLIVAMEIYQNMKFRTP